MTKPTAELIAFINGYHQQRQYEAEIACSAGDSVFQAQLQEEADQFKAIADRLAELQKVIDAILKATGWQSMDTAPTNGDVIEALYGLNNTSHIRWADERTCMLAGGSGGSGYFGEGWECAENHLIVDEPLAWREPQALQHKEADNA